MFNKRGLRELSIYYSNELIEFFFSLFFSLWNFYERKWFNLFEFFFDFSVLLTISLFAFPFLKEKLQTKKMFGNNVLSDYRERRFLMLIIAPFLILIAFITFSIKNYLLGLS